MRLRLEDNSGSSGVKYLYNEETGVAIPMTQLSGPFKGLKKRIKIKKAAKEKRFENRQNAKTNRQAARQARKQNRLDTRTARQESKKIKVIGKRAVTEAQQQAKIRKAQQDSAESPDYDESSDQLPEGSTDASGNSGQYMATPEDYGVDNTVDTSYEDVTDQPQEEEEAGGELSAGWIDSIVKVAKGAAGGIVNSVAPNSKVGNALLKIQNTKTGKLVTSAVKKGSTAVNNYNQMQQENIMLKQKVKNQQTTLMIAVPASIVVGYLAGRLIKRK